MYNKTKYLIGKISGIIAIVLGGFILLDALLFTVETLKLPGNISALTMLVLLLEAAIRWVLGVLILGRGLATIGAPFLYTSKEPPISFWIYSSLSKNISLIVICGILIGNNIYNASLALADKGTLATNVTLKLSTNMVTPLIQIVLAFAVIALKAVFLLFSGEAANEVAVEEAVEEPAEEAMEEIAADVVESAVEEDVQA